MVHRGGYLGLVLLATVACQRGPGSAPPQPSPVAVEPAPVAPVVPPSAAELVPVAIAPFSAGSSCNLVARDGNLYWLTQGFAPPPEEEPSAGLTPTATVATPHGGSSAYGAALDCARTRGKVWRVSTEPGSEPEVIANTSEWPWSLGASDDDLYWIGYCSGGLWTVPLSGGDPRRIGARDLSIIGHFPAADRVLVADRFGERRGVFSVDPVHDRTRPIVARGQEPWLLGERAGSIYWGQMDDTSTRVHVVDGGGLQWVAGFVSGHPSDTLVRGDEMYVLTTNAVVRVDPDAVEPLADVVEYHDRGNLAVDDADHLYWANGKPGTVARISTDGSGRVDAYLGGEPCGLAIDERYVYWLDRGRDSVMKVHRALFDDPPPIPPPVAEVDPADGLNLRVDAKAVKVRGGWGVDVTLHADVDGDETFRVPEASEIRFTASILDRDGTGPGFLEACSAPSPGDPELAPRTSYSWTRSHEADLFTVTPGDRLELEVKLCWLLTAHGMLSEVEAGTVVLDATGRGQPKLTIVPRGETSPSAEPAP
jgi:hypothetical protein